MLDLVMYGIGGVGIVGASYFFPLATMRACHKFGEKIESQNKLESIVSEESYKLGLEGFMIVPFFGQKKHQTVKTNYGYELHMANDSSATRSMVRHELYHIYKNDFKHDSTLRYFLLEEPRALLYGAFNIRGY
jgi:hypothetical protein